MKRQKSDFVKAKERTEESSKTREKREGSF